MKNVTVIILFITFCVDFNGNVKMWFFTFHVVITLIFHIVITFHFATEFAHFLFHSADCGCSGWWAIADDYKRFGKNWKHHAR